jgi:hypothetical protein
MIYDKLYRNKAGRRIRECHVRRRIRNELALKKPAPPTGPGAATVDRAKARMCATRQGGEPRTLPEDDTDLIAGRFFFAPDAR